jgi:glycosyltransferase involved in cell wall biosynthesis
VRSPDLAHTRDTASTDTALARSVAPPAPARIHELEQAVAPLRVVVPSFRSPQLVRPCLEAVLASETSVPMEVVLVDDGDNGDLEDLARAYPEVRVLREAPSGSAAVARNRGCAGFRGEVLVFVDVDVEVEPHAIENLTRLLREARADAAVGNYSRRIHGLGFAQQYKQLYLSRVYSRPGGTLRNHFWTALGAVRTEVFTDAGAFDPSFPGALGEDIEFGQRLTRMGYRVLAVPEALARNVKPYTVASLVANDHRKGRSMVSQYIGQAGVKLTDSRHSKGGDIFAVMLASAAFTSLAVAALPGPMRPVAAAAALLLSACYLSVRRELLAVFREPGPLFLLRAMSLMFLLDLVRAWCVARGVGLMAVRRLLPRSAS